MISTLASSRRGWFTLIAVLWLALTVDAGAQEPQESSPTGTFFGSVDVQVVNIDVHVTDKQGRPVTDLTLADFELYEDGRPVTISDFYAVVDGRPVATQGASDTVGPADSGNEARAPEPLVGTPDLPESQRLYLVIYVDNFNLHPLSRRWVIDGAQQFLLGYLEPDDRVLVVSYDRDLKLRTPGFVNDRRVIAEALEEAAMVTAHAVNRDAERNRVLQDIDRAENPGFALAEARSHAEFVMNETGFGIDAIREVVTKLAGIDGRKAMLYISDGMPMIAGEDLFLAASERFQALPHAEVFQYNMSQRFNELTAQANAGGVTLYTLDARGLHATQSQSAEFNYANLLAVKALIDNTRDLNLQSTLTELAADTGGQAILNTNALGPAFRGINQDLRTYYSLGYQPASIDGRYHRLEVKVDRPGVEVRHRAGYRAKAREQRVQESAVAALDFGLEKNPLEASLRFERGTSGDDGTVLVPVEIAVPLANLTLVPAEGVHHGRLRVLVGIRDQRGDTSGVIAQQPAELAIPEAELAQARRQNFVYALTLSVEPKPQQVAVTVVDDYGTEVSHLIHAINPGASRPSS